MARGQGVWEHACGWVSDFQSRCEQSTNSLCMRMCVGGLQASLRRTREAGERDRVRVFRMRGGGVWHEHDA